MGRGLSFFVLLFVILVAFPFGGLASSKSKPLVIVSGGFRSHTGQTAQKIFSQFKDVFRESDPQARELILLLTNFSGEFTDVNAPEDLYFDLWRHGTWTDQRQKSSPSEIIQRVKNLLADFGPRDVYLIGHSHGGWLAMKVALEVPRGTRIRRLVTLDPISRERCDAVQFRRELLNGLLRPRRRSDGENVQAPSDLVSYLETIRSKVSAFGQWEHYFQTQFPPTRSSHIAQATWSRPLSYPGGESLRGNAHERMAGDRNLFAEIAKRIQSDLKRR